MRLSVKRPLCPYNRHPLLAPREWIRRLNAANDLIVGGRSDLSVTASNSFALMLFLSGQKEEAKNILRSCIFDVTKHQPKSSLFLDSCFNFVRMARNDSNFDDFVKYLYPLLNAAHAQEIDLSTFLNRKLFPVALDKESISLICRHIIYEVMSWKGEQLPGWLVNNFKDDEHLQSLSGIIWREYFIYSVGNKITEPSALIAQTDDIVEKLIISIYIFAHLNNNKDASDYLILSLTLLHYLNKLKRIDNKFYNIILTVCEFSLSTNAESIFTAASLIGSNCMNADPLRQYRIARLRNEIQVEPNLIYADYADEINNIYKNWPQAYVP